MEKVIYIYPMKQRNNNIRFWEMLDEKGSFMASGSLIGTSPEVCAELRKRESRGGYKVTFYVGKVDLDKWSDAEIDDYL